MILPQYATEQKVLEGRRKQLTDSMETFFDEFQDNLRGPHNVKMDSAIKALLEDRLTKLQNKIQDFQNYAKNELIKMQETIDIRLKEVVVKELKPYCVNKNIVSIADHKSLLYCSACVDYTDDFVKYLKKKME